LSSHPAKPKALEESRGSGEDLYEFLVRELPPGVTSEARYFATALREAGARYDRYVASKHEWFHYGPRKNRLKAIAKSADELASTLCELDILSREDLGNLLNPKEIQALVGSLGLLEKVTTGLAKDVQENGKPRDLAEERWILDLADIYENAFGEPARVWGSGSDKTTKRRGKFYRMLELSRPPRFPGHGKLTVRQIDRTLKRRKKLKRGISLKEYLAKIREET
jgi:hypothetical protein